MKINYHGKKIALNDDLYKKAIAIGIIMEEDCEIRSAIRRYGKNPDMEDTIDNLSLYINEGLKRELADFGV